MCIVLWKSLFGSDDRFCNYRLWIIILLPYLLFCNIAEYKVLLYFNHTSVKHGTLSWISVYSIKDSTLTYSIQQWIDLIILVSFSVISLCPMDRLHILLWLQRILPGSVSWSQFLKNFLWHFLINHTSSFVLSYFFKDRIWWYITTLWAIHELVHMCVCDWQYPFPFIHQGVKAMKVAVKWQLSSILCWRSVLSR